MKNRLLLGAAALGFAAVFAVDAAAAQGTTNSAPVRTYSNATPAGARPDGSSNQQAAQQIVRGAFKTIQTMDANPGLKGLLRKARGVFIMPSYAHGALLVGGRGGTGIVMMHRADGSWSDPVFYDLGGVSVGPQVGGSYGQAVFLLMTRKSVEAFRGYNTFSLNANAGFNVVRYSASAQGSWGKGDVIFWTNTGGAYAGATVSISDVSYNGGLTKAFYGNRPFTIGKIFNGTVTTNKDDRLQRELPK